jgi:hypothetical protein
VVARPYQFQLFHEAFSFFLLYSQPRLNHIPIHQ